MILKWFLKIYYSGCYYNLPNLNLHKYINYPQISVYKTLIQIDLYSCHYSSFSIMYLE